MPATALRTSCMQPLRSLLYSRVCKIDTYDAAYNWLDVLQVLHQQEEDNAVPTTCWRMSCTGLMQSSGEH